MCHSASWPTSAKRSASFHPRLVGVEVAKDLARVPMVEADFGQLRQALVNLVGNAVKFTPHGEVSITPLLLPDNDQNQRRVSIAIRDSGIGIPAESLTRIFEAFDQADDSLSRTYGGTGLGLATCYGIVRNHGGSITVESAPGAGSRFAFELELGTAPAAAPARGRPGRGARRRLPAGR